MPYIPLQLPPGVFRNGTKYQSRGRWYGSNLVRWSEGAMQPVGGWERLQDQNGDIDAEGVISGLFAWRDNAGSAYLLIGTPEAIKVTTGGATTDLTDGSFTGAGSGDAISTEGAYGEEAYGAGVYGEGTELAAALTEAQSYQFDNFGEIPLMVATSDRRILEWDLNSANNVTAVSNAPTAVEGVVVTPERFVVALGVDSAGADKRSVYWSDREDRTNWTISSSTEAGDFTLATKGELMCGTRTRRNTLLFTTVDAWVMQYIGGVLIYAFQKVGDSCGIISRKAYAQSEGLTFWMGRRSFFMYDGSTVRPLPCEISDTIFNSLNQQQRSKVAAVAVPEFHEIWFMYPSGSATDNDKIVCFNYMENHWSGPWSIGRNCGIDSSIFGNPYLGGNEGSIFSHENGTAFVEPDGFASGAFSIPGDTDDGDSVKIGDVTYRFKTTMAAAYDVQDTGGSDEEMAQNLAAAINADDSGFSGGGGSGDAYFAGTEANPRVRAEWAGGSIVNLFARVPGTNGNNIPLEITVDPNTNFRLVGAATVEGEGSTTMTGGTDTAQTPSAESGPVEIGQGDNLMTIRRVIPDETSLGDVDLTLYAAMYPTATEETQSITTLNEPTDARLTGRQIRVEVTQDEPGWRLGVLRLEVVSRGRR